MVVRRFCRKSKVPIDDLLLRNPARRRRSLAITQDSRRRACRFADPTTGVNVTALRCTMQRNPSSSDLGGDQLGERIVGSRPSNQRHFVSTVTSWPAEFPIMQPALYFKGPTVVFCDEMMSHVETLPNGEVSSNDKDATNSGPHGWATHQSSTEPGEVINQTLDLTAFYYYVQINLKRTSAGVPVAATGVHLIN